MRSALYYVYTDTLPWESVAGLEHVDDLPYITRFKIENDRRDRLVSRRLIRALARDFVSVPIVIDIATDGKPSIAGFEFSISHCDGCIVVAHHSDPIGVDVEHRERTSDFKSIASRFFTDRECNAIGDDREQFFRLWTRKESVLKATGRGLKTPLNKANVLEDLATVDGATFSIQTRLLDRGFVVSWASTNPVNAEPVQLVPDPTLTDWTVLGQ